MYRRVVLTSSKNAGSNINVLYHVRGAVALSQYRRGLFDYNTSFVNGQQSTVVVFNNGVLLQAITTVSPNRNFEFILDVSENQPARESVEEVSSYGIGIEVYNANGVLVCRNVPKTPASGDPTQTVVPGEMTSVPGEEPGEMASETTDEPGAMI